MIKLLTFWVIFKFPGRSDYTYFEKKTTRIINEPIDFHTSPLYKVLIPLYSTKGDTVNYILYNDHPPDRDEVSSRAHSKGVIAFDNESGFLLMHSIPRFPPFINHNKQGEIYLQDYTFGQHIAYIPFKINQLQTLIAHQLVSRPCIYDYRIDDGMIRLYPTLMELIHRDNIVIDTKVDSLANQFQFGTLFSKDKEWGRNLFEDLIAPTLTKDFLVQTWQNGAIHNVMPSFCYPDYPFSVQNILMVCLERDRCWNHTHDHSKWAISTNKNSLTICIGDINRQYSQQSRGGTAFCFDNKELWLFLNQSVKLIEGCIFHQK